MTVVSVALVLAPPGGAIVGGTAIQASALAAGGQYQWLALVTNSGQSFCTGELVAPDWVRTAAHCLPMTTAFIGATSLPSSLGETISVDDSFANPSYDGVSPDFDQALLHLATASTRTPVPLPSASDLSAWARR